MNVETQRDDENARITYRITGQVFFASADAFIDSFDIVAAEGLSVDIDVTQAHFWDITAVSALEKVVQRYRAHDVAVRVSGLNAASTTLIDRLDANTNLT